MSADLRIAIVHFHLRGGGVTRVIANTLASLAEERVNVVVLTGEPDVPPELADYVCVIDGLSYTDASSTAQAEKLHTGLVQAAADKLGGPPDVWHLHNHSLGKNLNILPVVGMLAKQGACLLLHLHDFPEDGRPLNYLKIRRALPDTEAAVSEALYPQGTRIHYAVLNNRDRDFLRASGVGASRLHLLPNALGEPAGPCVTDADFKAPPRILYLTRAIRRKNLGEFLLWSAVSPPGMEWATSLAPQNPLARKVYDRWVAFAAHHRLPVEFEVGGNNVDFNALMASADGLISTSMAEGFGLSFLEPWLYGKPLVGRDLPEVTGGFAEAGVDLSDLYHRLDVPREWLDRERLFAKVKSGLSTMFESYNRVLKESDIQRGLQAIFKEGRADFGRLDEADQEQIIKQLLKDPARQRDLLPVHVSVTHDPARIMQNREAILESFSLPQYRKRLLAIYAAMVNCEHGPCARLDAEKLLDQYLQPERFCLIRS